MAGSMRILALNWRCLSHPQAGGGEVNLFEQARRWVQDGHEVTVLCADPGRQYAQFRDEVVDGVKVRRMGGRFTVYLRAALFLLRNGRRFDRILDVANGVPFFAALFSRSRAALIVHHVHRTQWFGEFPYPIAALGWFLERRVMPLVYRGRPVITISPTTREALINMGVAESQIRVVYCGVDHPRNGRTPPQPKDHRIAYVGRIRPYKRVDKIVRAVDKLRHEFPDIHLDIVGDGDSRPEIADLIVSLGLERHVTMHGHVDEPTKASILSSATVYATASMMEGWGISVIEANVFGCPAVAFDVPGLSAAIRHGETGLLAEDDGSFEQAIALLLRDRGERLRYSMAALRWAARFSWDSSARETLRVLDEFSGPIDGSPKWSSDRRDQRAA